MPTFVRLRAIGVCAILLGLVICHDLMAQSAPAANLALSANLDPVITRQDKDSIRILYTGRLLGYFRYPDWQEPSDPTPCNSKTPSQSASDFEDVLKKQFRPAEVDGAILLGAGDNFAPEIEARDFASAPKDRHGIKDGHTRLGKESFVWNGEKWVTYETVADLEKNRSNGIGQADSDFLDRLAKGQGTIPIDNVACFFTQEGYAAIVPGRHDFYFGPERLRELARRLATDPIPPTAKTLHNKDKDAGVQMLGANLVIETTWKKDHAPLSDKEAPPRFIPRFPTEKDLTLPIPPNIKIALSGLPPGGNVYPWFVGPKLTISGIPGLEELSRKIPTNYDSISEFEEALKGQDDTTGETASTVQKIAESKVVIATLLEVIKGSKFNLCKVKDKNFDTNTKTTEIQKCEEELHVVPTLDDKDKGALSFELRTANTKGKGLEAGMNYRLCINPPAANVKAGIQDMDDEHTFCVRMSVYTPLFQFPPNANVCQTGDATCYRDPKPYAWLEKKDAAGTPQDIVIFGVVDPHISDNIGLLNLAWFNGNEHKEDVWRTVVAAKDPAEALQELVAYFQLIYDKEKQPGSQLTRVLLAQMPPQQAEVLAARLGKFRIVVAAADEQLSRPDEMYSRNVIFQPPASEPSKKPKENFPQMMAVPMPYFQTQNSTQQTQKSPWIVDVGFLRMLPTDSEGRHWQVTQFHHQKASDLAKQGPSESEKQDENINNFWTAVDKEWKGDCMAHHPGGSPTKSNWNEKQIQFLTLCLIQEETGADVALLQNRDFFQPFPGIKPGHKTYQELLDRIIWKGDFLTLIYVPGSALKKALDQSKAFADDDKSALSLSDEKGRDFVMLGVEPDADRGEYLINGMLLDQTKLYAVATSDFVSVGDTGYPDLGSSQVEPPVLPNDFDKRLKTISSVVCNKLLKRAPNSGSGQCSDDFLASAYFDRLKTEPADPRKGKTAWRQLQIWSIFYHLRPVPGSKPPQESKQPQTPGSKQQQTPESQQNDAKLRVTQRALWDLKLSKWSIGVTTLSHTGSDFDVQNTFSGITSPGILAFRSTTLTSDLQAQWTRSWQHDDLFFAPGYTYNTQYKGQPDNFRQINQISDMGTFDMGFDHHLPNRPRQPDEIDAVLTAHFETPLTKAFNSFALATSHTGEHGEPITDQIRFDVDRSYTLLMRPGIRWKKRISSFELGPELGHEWNALQQIDFFTAGLNPIPCAATAATSISQCVKNALKANPKSITPTSDVETVRVGQDHAGMYWKLNLTVPFNSRVSYVLTDTGDWFFVHYNTDTSVGTLLRDSSQHQLKFNIFPSFSIGPEFDLLLYQNKSTLALRGHFLQQDLIMMKAQFNFDLINRHYRLKQIQYTPPAASK